MQPQTQAPIPPAMQSFPRTGIPSAVPNTASPEATNAELTGDSLWDSLYNTTIRTLSLDGLELLAKSFDNLDPNHQLYAGIAKRQRKLMEYQSEFRRNLEVFCQRANLSPKLWPSCIRHVKPSPRLDTSVGLDLLNGWSKPSDTTPPGSVKSETQNDATPTTPKRENAEQVVPQQMTPSISKDEESVQNGQEEKAEEKSIENQEESKDEEKKQEELSAALATSSLNDEDSDKMEEGNEDKSTEKETGEGSSDW